jgi:hypothetical protein
MTPRWFVTGVLASFVGSVGAGCTVDSAGMDAGRPDTGRPDVRLPDAPQSDVPPIDDAGFDAGMSDVPVFDAPLDARADVPVDAAADGGTDAPIAPLDAGTDAGSVGTDAGSPPPNIDGTLSTGEWARALTTVDVTTSIWAGNELRGLRVLVQDGSLYLALEGRIEGSPANAMAVYVDRDLDEAIGVASLATLTDATDPLDTAITAAFTTPAGFRTDLVFGTLDMARSASGSDPRMGWRDLNRAASVADLYWVTAAVAPVACSATACETRLPLSELGGTAPRRMGFFARIVSGDSSASPNQTLPSDDGAMPRTVSMVLELNE